jgi:hypothetical protein
VVSGDFGVGLFLDEIGRDGDMLQTHELLLQLVYYIITRFFVSLIYRVLLHFFNDFILPNSATSLGACGTLRGHCYFDMILSSRLGRKSIVDVISSRFDTLPFSNNR